MVLEFQVTVTLSSVMRRGMLAGLLVACLTGLGTAQDVTKDELWKLLQEDPADEAADEAWNR